MRLIDHAPRFCVDADIVLGGVAQHFEGRDGMGLTFDCPCCRGTERATRLAVWFANPLDGLPPTDDATLLWTVTGDNFENLTLSPSLDASEHKHAHISIVDGKFR